MFRNVRRPGYSPRDGHLSVINSRYSRCFGLFLLFWTSPNPVTVRLDGVFLLKTVQNSNKRDTNWQKRE